MKEYRFEGSPYKSCYITIDNYAVFNIPSLFYKVRNSHLYIDFIIIDEIFKVNKNNLSYNVFLLSQFHNHAFDILFYFNLP